MTIDERISSELRRDLPNVDEHGAWDQIQRLAAKRRNRQAIALVALPAAVLVLVLVGLRLSSGASDNSATDVQASPFVGVWISISDSDGGTQTMTIDASDEDAVEIVVLDDHASVCSGVPSTMTGIGRLVGVTELLIPAPVYTCDDGSEPEVLSGPPLHEQLLDLTLIYQLETDGLTDNFGSVWTRQAAEGSNPGPRISGSMWPQSSLDEVKEAQRLADAGDPDYTWQVDPELAQFNPQAEILARFLREHLGWEKFSGGGGGLSNDDGTWMSVDFIRCAPDLRNLLYPNHPCAPTIDELRYETVSVEVAQLGQRGAEGIWVVSRWQMRQTKFDPGSLFGLLYPDFSERQVEQVVPPTEAEVTALLQAFLGAREDGEGAEQYLLREPAESPFEDQPVPLLYATTGGAAYDRSEIEHVQGPVWPTGWSEFKVRLFAEGGTVVEQYFYVVRQQNRQLGLVYGYKYDGVPTTENGQSVPVPFSILDGEVTFAAAPPWNAAFSGNPGIRDTLMRVDGSRDDHVVIATDPLPVGTGCENGSAPADAEALAQRIMADPNFDTTGTVPVRIAGIDGLQIDVDAAVDDWNDFCWPWVPDQSSRWRMRLYLIDYPGESAAVLTIAVIAAPETDFERVLKETTPIVESLEFHTP